MKIYFARGDGKSRYTYERVKRLMWEDKILHNAVAHFGADNQLNKLTEEAGELLVAVAHWRIGKDSASHVAEEIADTLIMLKQAAIILDIEANVEKWHMDKLCALEKRVGGMAMDKKDKPRAIRLGESNHDGVWYKCPVCGKEFSEWQVPVGSCSCPYCNRELRLNTYG